MERKTGGLISSIQANSRPFPWGDFLITGAAFVTPLLIILAYPTFVRCSIPEAVLILSMAWFITFIGRKVISKLTRPFPRADFLIAGGRFVTNYPLLIILAYPTFVLCSIPEAVLILLIVWFITFIGRKVAVAGRDLVGLLHLCKDILERGVKVYDVTDYFPNGLPVQVLRGLKVITPYQRILRIPRLPSYETIQYQANKSFVLVPFEPTQANPTRLYCLLHELGHIGHRNYLGADSHLIGAIEALFASVPLFFARPSSFISYIILWLLVSMSVQSTNGGVRIEAEVEADHSALFQLMLFRLRDMNEPSGPFSKPGLDPLTSEDLGGPPRDRNMFPGDNYVRRSEYEIMREHAKQGKIRNSEFYIWRVMRNWEYKAIILWSSLIFCAAYCISFQDVGISWVGAGILLFLLLCSLFIVILRQMSLIQIETLLNKHGAHDKGDRGGLPSLG
jgi:hypothetical protein